MVNTLVKYKTRNKGLMLKKITSFRGYCLRGQRNYESLKIFKKIMGTEEEINVWP